MDRRRFLKFGALAGTGFACSRSRIPQIARAQGPQLSVLSTQKPDPIPPGVDDFSNDLLDIWKGDHNDAVVEYSTRPFFELAGATKDALATGGYTYDIFYNWATIPELARNLTDIGARLPQELLDDLAPSQAKPLSWQDRQYGISPTLSLLIPFYNQNILQAAGIMEPPETWVDLKTMLDAFIEDPTMKLLVPYGARAGIGGVTSIWMMFLQQAGGTMYDDAGRPVFDEAPGIDALQFMIDLMPNTHPDSLRSLDYGQIAFRMSFDYTAITLSFPAFWTALNNNAPPGEGAVAPMVMLTGPENNATVSGADAWTVASNSPNQDLSLELIEFYLSPEVQQRQYEMTGWLPVRLSALEDAELQAANPIAAVLRGQANAPFDSFLTPNYLDITDAIGIELQKALAGEQSAVAALRSAKSAIQPLISWS